MLRSILIGLISLSMAIVAPMIVTLTPGVATTGIPIHFLPATNPAQIALTMGRSSAETTAQSLLQQGIDRYEREQFAEAIELWQQANQQFTAAGNTLGQALTLSNLSSLTSN